MRYCVAFLFSVLLIHFTACADTTDSLLSDTGGSVTIFIADHEFIPSSLTVSAGDTIFFDNQDDTTHRILSESATGVFDDTGVFDTGYININGFGSLTIPDTAVSGDTFYFYSDILQDAMSTPDGTFVVE